VFREALKASPVFARLVLYKDSVFYVKPGGGRTASASAGGGGAAPATP